MLYPSIVTLSDFHFNATFLLSVLAILPPIINEGVQDTLPSLTTDSDALREGKKNPKTFSQSTTDNLF